MKFTLPFPPPVNNLYRNARGRGRVKTDRYLAWQNHAGYELENQAPPERISGPIEVTMRFGRPDRRKRDLDGLLKAPLDLLVAHDLIDDDRHVESILAHWSSEVTGVEIEVRRA